ncbi:MAG: glycoside hydrolase family 3 C-terminal domain-containing protein [Candidatus Solibacter sp.]
MPRRPAKGSAVRYLAVEELVRRLTLDEKIALVHGSRDPRDLGQAGYWAGLPERGIPPLRFADGPPGINVNREATAMPAPVALAATFDVEAARLYGAVMGREARALEQNVLLTPHVNIVRDPIFRRNHTTLAEDPLLAARIAAAEVAAIQREGVMAQVKHLAAYSGPDNVLIDERTLHELYLPPFEAAVQAGVASVMCAYNKINGDWACENPELQERILRGQWDFRGFVTSDWGALRGPAAILAGVDLEMPGRELAGRPGPYFRDALKQAIESGAIPLSALDRAVTRILEQLDRFGYLGRKAAGRAGAIDVVGDARVVREIALRGAVLLKNEDRALPLRAGDLERLAVIGPTAGQLAAGYMGERAYGFEARLVSPLDALRKTVPSAAIAYSVGVDLTGSAIPGVEAEAAIEPGGERSWSGTLMAPEDGEYTLMVQPVLGGGSEGGGSIRIDGRQVARNGGPGFAGTGRVSKKWSGLLPTTDGRDNARGTIRLAAGPHRAEFSAYSISEGPLRIRFAWIAPAMRRAGIEAAVEAARNAHAAVVFAWSGLGGADLTLPEGQDEMIERVASANPHTVVVLNTGGPVTMPWIARVPAVLEMWYPGQEGGWAAADLLLGRANPAGHLPVTFPVRLEDAPARAVGHPERLPVAAAPGTTGVDPDPLVVRYTEGLAVGYRWYDQQNIQPLFPFGHGLSYTRFEYSRLEVRRTPDGGDVAFTVRNAGGVRGSEVAQVYLAPPARPPVPMVPQSLVGFERVELAAGAARRVTVHLDQRAFSYWSTDGHVWRVAEGERVVSIAASSRDIRLEGRIAAPAKR